MRTIEWILRTLNEAPYARSDDIRPFSAAARVHAAGQPLRLVFLVTVVFVCMGQAATRAVEVIVTRVDGTTIEGQWLELAPDGGMTIAASTGSEQIAVDDVLSVVFARAADRPAPVEPGAPDHGSTAMLYLADGGQLPGTFLGGGEETVRARTALGASLDLPLAALAGLRLVSPEEFPRAESLFQSALRDRLPGQDVLVTREADEPKVLRGRLQSIDADSGSFTLGKQTRTFRMDRIYGLVFATGVSRIDSWPMRFELRDGTVFTGRLAGGDDASVKVVSSFSDALTVALGSVRRLDARSPRVVYLSDIDPTGVQVEGRVHRPWEISRDHGLMGQRLSLDGEAYAKGIACHSRSELNYDLSEPYVAFVAHVGIDDDVRPRGSVVFRVLGDGKELFSSGLVTGRDASRLVRVGMEGVNVLTLMVDYGDELDVADHAIWGGARLLRP